MVAEARPHTFGRSCLNVLRDWLPVMVAGGGFGLTFGWVWFAPLFARVVSSMPAVFSGTFFSGGGISAFSFAFTACLIGLGLLARRLPDQRTIPLMAHGAAILLLTGGVAVREAAPLMAALLLGVAAAGPGAYWTAPLLALPPVRAGAALAISALVAWGMTTAVSIFGGMPVLLAGPVLALGLSTLRHLPNHGAGQAVSATKNEETTMPHESAGWLEKTLRDNVLPFILLCFAFFAAGILAPAAAAPIDADLPVYAAGSALAVFCCIPFRGKRLGASALALGAVLPMALLLPIFSAMDGANILLGALMEGAALIALADAQKEGTPIDGEAIALVEFSRTGFGLAALFCLVNLGGVTGAAVIRTGDAGGWLLASVCAVLCPPFFLLAAKWRNPARQKEGETPSLREQSVMPAESVSTPDGVSQEPSMLWSGLTRRERAVSELLIRNKSNTEICNELFVTENTVRTHIKNIYHKTGATSRDELKELLRESR